MGTVRAWLHDDLDVGDFRERLTQMEPVMTQMLDDGPQPEGAQVNPVLTVRTRARTGFDDDGVPQFEWTVLVTGQAIKWETRLEFDSNAGATKTTGKATMLYSGDVVVGETAMVTDDGDGRWRVTAVGQIPGYLTLTLARLVDG